MKLRSRQIRNYGACIAAVITIVLVFVYCGSPKARQKEEFPYLNLSDSAHYVGINTCKQCHQSIYESFIQTGMGQSFGMASKAKSSARFDKHALVYDKARNFYYRPFWDRDTFKITEYRLEGKDTIHKRTEKINYIIGSGQHTNSHMMNRNGYVFQVPITFYTQKGEWDLPPGFENGANQRFGRQIGLECMSCHNSYPGYVEGSENKYTEIPQGINCERCHGPGSIHVKEKMAGHTVNIANEIDYSIVNPAKLPVDLQFEICQRCHLQGNAVLNEGKSFYDFKPGMKVSNVMNVFMPKFKGHENEYIMASHVERLKMSACFIKTMEKVKQGTIKVTDKLKPYKDALTCVTCHNPHVSVKFTGEEVFNNACRKCHNGSENKLCTRNKEAAHAREDMQAGNCAGCHMPKANTIDIPHVVTTDHFIRKPVSPQELNKVKQFLGIVCINNPRPERKTIARGYIQYFEKFDDNPASLDSAAVYLSDKTTEQLKDNFQDLVYLHYVKKDYANVVEYAARQGFAAVTSGQKRSWDNRDAWVDYRIGDSYFNTGSNEEAYRYINLSVQLSPYNLEFRNQLGAVLTALGRHKEALNVFSGILKENPDHVPALSNLGFTYLVAENNVLKARDCYDKALLLDPDYEQGLLNKAGLMIYQKSYSEAKKLLNHLLQRHPNNKQAKEILISLNAMN